MAVAFWIAVAPFAMAFLLRPKTNFALVALALIGLLIPFALGFLVDRHGWILGACLALLWLFVELPWEAYPNINAYLWTAGNNVNKPYIWIAIAIPAAAVAAGLGTLFLRRRSGKLMHVDHWYTFYLPIICVTLAMSLGGVPVLKWMHTSSAETLSFPKYHFFVTEPAGWYKYSSENPNNDEQKEMGSIFGLELSGTIIGGYGNDADAYIDVYDKIPYTDIPVSSLTSSEAVYKALRQAFEAQLPKHSGAVIIESPRLKVDGVDSVSFYADFQNPDEHYPQEYVSPFFRITDHRRTRFRKPIYVYRKPYLYEIDFSFGYSERYSTRMSFMEYEQSAAKTYREILKSFKFL